MTEDFPDDVHIKRDKLAQEFNIPNDLNLEDFKHEDDFFLKSEENDKGGI